MVEGGRLTPIRTLIRTLAFASNDIVKAYSPTPTCSVSHYNTTITYLAGNAPTAKTKNNRAIIVIILDLMSQIG